MRDALTSGRLRVEPEARRNEVLAFVEAGLRDFSVSRPRALAGLGHPGSGRPEPDHLRVVRRAGQLHQRARLRRRSRRRLTNAGGATPTSACTSSARESCGSTRSRGRRSCCRPASRSRPPSWCTTTSPSTARRSPSRSATPSIRSRSSTGSEPTRCDGGCCARCRASATPTSPSPVSSTPVNRDLANGVGNLVSRVVSLVHARRADTASRRNGDAADTRAVALRHAVDGLPARIDDALDRFDFRRRARSRPGDGRRGEPLPRAHPPVGPRGERSAVRIEVDVSARGRDCRTRRRELAPFVPGISARAVAALGERGDPPATAALFPRLVAAPRSRHPWYCVSDPCGWQDTDAVQVIDVRRFWVARRKRSGAGDPSARPATSSPTSGANLKPCPEHGEQITTGPTRSITKSSVGVDV